MKRNFAISSTLAATLLLLPVSKAWAEDDGADTLSADDLTALVDERKDDIDNDVQFERYIKEYDLDIRKKTAKVTGRDRTHKQEALEAVRKVAAERSARDQCNRTPPKIKIDIAVVKDTPDSQSSPPIEVVEHLMSCGHAPRRDADDVSRMKFVNKIKTIHFKLAKTQPEHSFYDMQWDEKTGTVTVGIRVYGVNDVENKVGDWVRKQ